MDASTKALAALFLEQLGTPSTPEQLELRSSRPTSFRATGDARCPYAADVQGEKWVVRLNEFPEEPSLYTLMLDGQPLEDLMDWPAAWTRPTPR